MANEMAMVQIGNTVLLRYPTPNCLNSPSGPYANLGLNQWNAKNNIKNIVIAADALLFWINILDNIGNGRIVFSYILDGKQYNYITFY